MKTLFYCLKTAILLLPYLNYASEPSTFTVSKNKTVLKQLPFDQQQDFEDATRGLIAPLADEGIVKNSEGRIVWDLKSYDFLKSSSPDFKTMNPSLYRQGQLLTQAGLFKVTEKIYQVRGADLSNMTIIEGKEGIIVIDPLVSEETAKAAIELYFNHRPKVPIKAVIYSHSHVDHFGGVKGIITQQDVNDKKVKVYAPKGFTDAALDENVMAGNVMGRRSVYMYGNLLKPGPLGQMTSGLGLTSSTGKISLILPTNLIRKTGERKTIDGVKFVFLMAPGAEAPAEIIFYLPELKALGIAEEANDTMHNLYSLRGAKPRDARAWAKYLNQSIIMFGPQVEVVFGQHHWPKWGNAHVIDYLTKQRDLYKYIHDQTLRLANQGYTMLEIAEIIKLPDSLAKAWENRSYYGSLNHNAKAVYDFYLGWFDGNPSTLHQLPPVQASKKYVEYMGGAEKVLERAKQDFNRGEYRWVSQVLNHVVFADPKNQDARNLLADTLEQMGYQDENATWRNFYLSGALELRQSVHRKNPSQLRIYDLLEAMPNELLFDYLAIRLNGPRADEQPMKINITLSDEGQKYLLEVNHGVLNAFSGKHANDALASMTLSRLDLLNLALEVEQLDQLIKDKKVIVEGSRESLNDFFSLFDTFNFWFNIIEPQG
ncbi:MAG: alkyl sulfatase dimerization domain-containing protein [Parachlamydiaceae bacterium]|nr:alkyl sulfatase dimerization domain-containing protein [Parachlamydiaceae bacterium]